MKNKLKLVLVLLSLFAIGITQLQGQGGTARAVTQITSATTGVTINSSAGVITTVSETTAAVTKTTFTVTNSAVQANSTVIAGIQNYSGTYATNGIPVVTVSNVVAGAFDVNVVNVHAANALAGTLAIGFLVQTTQ